MKLNNNKVIMRAKEGKPTPEKAIDVFRMGYYIILISIVLYVAYFYLVKSFVIKGEGFVTFEQQNIESPYTGVVKDLNITKFIHKGQFLCNVQERIKNSGRTSTTRLVTPIQIINLKLKINSLQTQYLAGQKRLYMLEKDFRKAEYYNSLGLYNPSNTSFQTLKNQIAKLKINQKVIKTQIREYKKGYADLLKFKNPIVSSKPLFSYINHPIYSPTQGNFIKGIENNNTPIKAGQLLFKIQTYKNLHIVGYFSQKYVNDLKVGDDVTIIIAHNNYDGKIINITTSFSQLNFKTLQKLQLTIVPVDKNITFWKRNNLLRVKLRKYEW